MIKVNFELQTAFHNSHKPIGKQNNKYSTIVKKRCLVEKEKNIFTLLQVVLIPCAPMK